MARAPDERITEAKAMYLGGVKLVEIASQLNLPEGTVRRWKSTHKWESERSDKMSERSNRKKGAQPGNKNAVDGGAPEQNKNAVTTGEFETLFFDTLDSDERKLISAVQLDKEKLLLQEIQLLTVRERRMLKRIEDLKLAASEQTEKKADGMTPVKYKAGTEKDKWTDLVEYTGALGQIQSIENALTRVQAQKQRAIDALHRFGFDDTRLEIELMKAELAILKENTQEPDIKDDGFMAAINAEASEIWSDEDD